MKKILFVILAVFAFASCSSDESELKPADGQYIAYSGDLVICLLLQNGSCTYFAPFINGSVLSSWLNVNTSGEYPTYVYRIDDFMVQAYFDSRDSFTATLDGVLSTSIGNYLQNGTALVLDNVDMQFQLDNTVLDANGDGILDSKQ